MKVANALSLPRQTRQIIQHSARSRRMQRRTAPALVTIEVEPVGAVAPVRDKSRYETPASPLAHRRKPTDGWREAHKGLIVDQYA